jgi:hypothetical protein
VKEVKKVFLEVIGGQQKKKKDFQKKSPETTGKVNMARKRRKGEQGNEDDKGRKRFKSTLPQDTNIEILPAKAPIPEHNDNPAQVPLL